MISRLGFGVNFHYVFLLGIVAAVTASGERLEKPVHRQLIGILRLHEPIRDANRFTSLRMTKLVSAELAHDGADELFGVAEEHQGVIEVVEGIVDAGETWAHAALDHHHGVGFVDIEDGHAVDGAGGVRSGGGVGDVIGADHKGNVGLGEVAVDLIHFDEAVVGDVGFGEEDVHVAGHASGDGMDGKTNFDALFGEDVVEFANLVLRLGHGHAVAGDDNHFVGGRQDRSRFLGGRAVHGTGFRGTDCRRLYLAECAEQNVGERTVHRFRHDYGEDESGRAVKGASDDQELGIEDKSHGRGGETGVAVQEGDDRRHVGAADGDNQQDSEDQRDADDQWEELFGFGMQDQINGAADGDGEQQEVDEVLSFIGDGPLGQDLLQLSRRHEAAGNGEASEDDFHGEHRHHEFGNVRRAQIKFRRTDQSDAECAEGVAEGSSLRDGGHLHHAKRDADAAAEHEGDDDPLPVDDAVAQQSAGDGQHHADFASPDAVAGGGGGTHPFQRENKEGAGDQVSKFDDVLVSGEIGIHLFFHRAAGLEHLEHAVGDQESANHVAGGGDNGNHP
jgi:hypothetical protein